MTCQAHISASRMKLEKMAGDSLDEDLKMLYAKGV